MFDHHTPHAQPPVSLFLLSDALAQFRRRIEGEAGEPIETLEVNAALFLSDFCRFLQLGHQAHHRVLGDQAAAFVQNTEDTSVRLNRMP